MRDYGQPSPDYRQVPLPPTGQPETAPPRPKKGLGLGLKIFYVIVILVVGGASVGLFVVWTSQRSEISELKENGVETSADVGTVTTTRRNGQVVFNDLNISFQTEGSASETSTSVMDCSADRWEPGETNVDVVYLPDDPEVVRLAGCASSAGVFPVILGTVFGAFALFMLWRLPRMFRGR